MYITLNDDFLRFFAFTSRVVLLEPTATAREREAKRRKGAIICAYIFFGWIRERVADELYAYINICNMLHSASNNICILLQWKPFIMSALGLA